MNENTSEQTPANLPAIGSKVQIQCSRMDCPFASRVCEETLRGWEAFFAGEPDPKPSHNEFGEGYEGNPFANGWKLAKSHKTTREYAQWTLSAIEDDEDGGKVVVLTREEVNSYDDVMNGSGTGLGTHTVTERVKLS